MIGKKGASAEKVIYYGVFGVVLTFIFFFLVWVIQDGVAAKLYIPPEAQKEIFIQRFLGSPECFAYSKGLTWTSILDWKRISNESLRKCYDISDIPSDAERDTLAFRLHFTLIDKGITRMIETSNWIDWKGYEREKPRFVNIVYKNETVQGQMVIEVQDVG